MTAVPSPLAEDMLCVQQGVRQANAEVSLSTAVASPCVLSPALALNPLYSDKDDKILSFNKDGKSIPVFESALPNGGDINDPLSKPGKRVHSQLMSKVNPLP